MFLVVTHLLNHYNFFHKNLESLFCLKIFLFQTKKIKRNTFHQKKIIIRFFFTIFVFLSKYFKHTFFSSQILLDNATEFYNYFFLFSQFLCNYKNLITHFFISIFSNTSNTTLTIVIIATTVTSVTTLTTVPGFTTIIVKYSTLLLYCSNNKFFIKSKNRPINRQTD